MKKISIFASLFAMLAGGIFLTSCKVDPEPIDITPGLSEAEESSLIFLREEEKLARDVYNYMGDKYNEMIFGNIASSEQKHLDFVLEVMAKYEIGNTGTDEVGVFTNPDLQALYNELIEKGDKSVLDAMLVGATIEDVDIKDLEEALKGTSNEDLSELYAKLKCGSENHMRAFNKQVENKGGTYIPQYISQELFEEILAGAHTHCGQ